MSRQNIAHEKIKKYFFQKNSKTDEKITDNFKISLFKTDLRRINRLNFIFRPNSGRYFAFLPKSRQTERRFLSS
jgi:hypothetical protein